MKHVCVFLAFWNVNIIKTSFESLYHDEMDFIILENHSKYSDEIYQYFKNKKLKGYIKYEKNAALCAWNIFIRDHRKLLLEYDYITMTDGDLYFYDIKETFREIREGLDKEDCIIASAGLYKANHYDNKKRIMGIKYYNEFMRARAVDFGCYEGHTAGNLITIKKENLPLFENIHFGDTHLRGRTKLWGKKWYKTNKYIAYHLTWDVYVKGNEYYKWKISVVDTIWRMGGEFKYTYKLDPTKQL